MPQAGPKRAKGEKEPGKAVIYARIASQEQTQEGVAIAAQLTLLREYAATSGFAVEGEYSDFGSAMDRERAGLGAMIRYLGRHKSVRTILVEKANRLFRNPRDWMAFEDLGIKVHTIMEGRR